MIDCPVVVGCGRAREEWFGHVARARVDLFVFQDLSLSSSTVPSDPGCCWTDRMANIDHRIALGLIERHGCARVLASICNLIFSGFFFGFAIGAGGANDILHFDGWRACPSLL